MDHPSARARAQTWARQMLADPAALILDTETTGLGSWDEIVSIAIITMQGETVYQSLVKPTIAILPEVTAIHHITNAMVLSAPTYRDIAPTIFLHCFAATLIAYGADFDRRLLAQSAYANQVVSDLAWRWEDCMRPYAEYIGEYSHRYGSYTWQKLPGGDHSALGDALACLAIIKEMAA